MAELRRSRARFGASPRPNLVMDEGLNLRIALRAHCGDAGETRTRHPSAVPARVSDPGDAELRRRLYVDCETTGFNPGHDVIIELTMLPFTYTFEGSVVEVLQGRRKSTTTTQGARSRPKSRT